MYCQSCGKEIDEGSRFCRHCGAQTILSGTPGTSAYPPAGAYSGPRPGAPAQPLAKSRIAAGILAILIGHLGIHNFYLGFTGKAVAQLLMSVLSCGTLLIVSWIWAVVEGIMILTGSINADADGVPFKD